MVTLRMASRRPGSPHYDGKRIVVTGGAGFVGHHLVRALTGLGAKVLVIDDLSTGRQERLDPAVEVERRDIAEDDLATTITRWRTSTIFHLAAQVSVPRSEADPEFDLRVNGVGTSHTPSLGHRMYTVRVKMPAAKGRSWRSSPTRHGKIER